MATDGSVVIEFDANTNQAEKKLAKLKRDIEKSEQALSAKREGRLPLEKELDKAVKAAGDASNRINQMKSELAEAQDAMAEGFDIPFDDYMRHRETATTLPEEIKAQEENYAKLNAYSERIVAKVSKYDKELEEAENHLKNQKEEAGRLAQQIDAVRAAQDKAESSSAHTGENLRVAGESSADLSENTNKANGFLNQLGKRTASLAKQVFVFSAINSALRFLSDYMGKVLRTNDEASAAFSRLKGALLTLAQPILSVLIPALTTLANILTHIVTGISRLISLLFGQTLEQSQAAAEGLYHETEALEGVGAAAEEAAGSLAGFDELNIIDTGESKGGGGGGKQDDIAPDFSQTDALSDRLKNIAELVALIGAGFALWKIGNSLTGPLANIISTLGLIIMLIGSVTLFAYSFGDAWNNGVDWGNLIGMFAGLGIAAFALYKLFGPMVAGITLVVGGIAMLVLGFKDTMENGWNLQNTLTSIAGILAAGVGIGLMTGSWIPMLIAAIASVLLALTVATGHGEELIEGVRSVLRGFVDFFAGIITGDMERAIQGVEGIFDGLKTAIFAIFDGIKDTFNSFIDWIDEKTDGKLRPVLEFVRNLFNSVFNNIRETVENVIDSVKQIFSGIVQFVSGVISHDWDSAWEGIKNIFRGAWNGIVSILEGAINLVIDGINWLFSKLNLFHIDIPDWLGGGSFGFNFKPVERVSIRRLAQGAVIPPNREFMAVLGDQTSGNNIEAPESLIRRIVREESGNSGGGDRPINITMVLDGKVIGRVAVKEIRDNITVTGKVPFPV